MAELHQIVQLYAVLGALGTASPSYTVPSNERLIVRECRVLSTGAVSITDIRDSGNRHYTSASAAIPLPSTYFQHVDSPNLGNTELTPPIEVEGGATFTVDIVDTSGGANTVRLMFECTRVTP
jgi:hypothetical protein